MEPSARAALAADVDRAARLKGSFKLRSGQVSDEYFDKYRFEADPALLARVAAAMLPLVPDEAEVLAGLELGGVPIATAMSLQSRQARRLRAQGSQVLRNLPGRRRRLGRRSQGGDDRRRDHHRRRGP
jgi:orotate phosphoribosyltransferase